MNQSLNITLDDNKALPILFGEKNRNISDLEKKIGVAIATRGNIISISGDSVAVATAKMIINALYEKARKGFAIGAEEIDDEIPF
jgi:phosphate starvation-inducible PhoH-like protein